MASALPSARSWVFKQGELDKAVAAHQSDKILTKAQMALLRAAADPLFFAQEFKRETGTEAEQLRPTAKGQWQHGVGSKRSRMRQAV